MKWFDLPGLRFAHGRAAANRSPLTTLRVSNVSPATARLPEVPGADAVQALLAIPPRPRFNRITPSEVDGADDITAEEDISEEWDQFMGWRPPPATPPKPIEDCSASDRSLVDGIRFHPLVAAVAIAFREHRPLVLSPDMIWLLIAQGFANHVNANAAALRPRLVDHAGTVAITVRRDEFVMGSPANPWREVIGDISQQIRAHIGAGTHDLLVPTFSTTGEAERAAAEVVLLGALKEFFSYRFETLCGIPQILLEGTDDDWELLASRTRGLGRFDFEWWTTPLAPILDEFIAAVRGRTDARFWQSIYKLEEESGGPYINGWLTAFFPYLTDQRSGWPTERNPWLEDGGRELLESLFPLGKKLERRRPSGPKTSAFPTGLTCAPFAWQYLDRRLDMEFLGGFVGVRQEPDSLRLRPEIGWAVREQTPIG